MASGKTNSGWRRRAANAVVEPSSDDAAPGCIGALVVGLGLCAVMVMARPARRPGSLDVVCRKGR
jgi:hypothetical protein